MSVSSQEFIQTQGERVAARTSAVASPRIIAIGGGKGGVGKTCFAVNTAVEIARRGWRVVIVDADLSCANVETMLGMHAKRRLDDFFDLRRPCSLASITEETPYENLRIIAGTTGLLDVANPRFQQKEALIGELQALDADVIIVDLDAGARLNTLDFFLVTLSHGVLIITPERTSIDNAFKFLRAALYRRIERFYDVPEVGLLLKRHASMNAFLQAIDGAPGFSPELRDQVRHELTVLARSFRPKIVVNKVNNAYEAQIAAQILAKHARDHLLVRPECLGYIYFDQAVSEAVNSGIPVVLSRPRLRVSGCVVDMANRLGYF